MNAKDTELMNVAIEAMKLEFATALREALAPLVEHINALEQRSSNFAARVNASNKMYRAEITSLRDQVERLTPKAPTPPPARLSDAQWNAATASLRVKLAPKTFFAPGDVRAEHTLLCEAAEHARFAGGLSNNLVHPADAPQAKAVMAVADEEEVLF